MDEQGECATRGFCFIDFDEKEDAEAAVDNMDGAELLGSVLQVSHARARRDE